MVDSHPSDGLRLVKGPNVFVSDSGLAGELVGAPPNLVPGDLAIGPLLETFVAGELLKQASWSTTRPELLHFRKSSGKEIDFVLEARVGGDDFRGLAALAEATGERYVRGIVLYTGSEIVPFGKSMHALPLPSLWGR